MARRRWWARRLGLVLGLALVGAGLLDLWEDRDGVLRTDTRAGSTPVTVLTPKNLAALDGEAGRDSETGPDGQPGEAGPDGQPGEAGQTGRAPVVVVAHGFSGARELMQAFSLTLAKNGYVVVAFDFPGHGDHPRPLAGTLGSPERVESLMAALGDAVSFGLELGGGRVALLGHSMAGDILLRHAKDDPDIAAVVGLSPYVGTSDSFEALRAPLLVAYGGWEADMLIDLGRAAVASAADLEPADIEPGRTYGSRQLLIVPGAEHIGILFSAFALESAVRWLDAAFDRPAGDPIALAPRGLGLCAYYLGVLLVGFALAAKLPVVTEPALGAGLRGRRFAAAGLAPAVLTPVILALVPTDLLPSLLTDYVALHFLVYGLLTLGLMGSARRGILQGLRARPFALALAAVLVFEMVALGWATDRLVSQFFPGPNRSLATLFAFFGAIVWLAADEHLTRGPEAPRFAHATTKACFLASLLFAVALDPNELFFLVLIVPAVLILFTVLGLLGGFIHRRTGHPLIAAIAHAIALALPIAATFPVVGSG